MSLLNSPSEDAVAKTIDALRKHSPAGSELKTPRGPMALRLKPFRDAETNKQLIVMGKMRNEPEGLFKDTPVLNGWSVDSSAGNGFIFASNEVLGDAGKHHPVSKPASSIEMPRVVAFVYYLEAVGIGGGQHSIVDQGSPPGAWLGGCRSALTLSCAMAALARRNWSLGILGWHCSAPSSRRDLSLRCCIVCLEASAA
eukprot:2448034-Pyramimonas_sp.AAC.1